MKSQSIRTLERFSTMYTCNSCSLQFPTPEDQRSHMKSDWHRYNLKRRVANLPAIDEDLFNEKVQKLSLDDSQNENDGSKDKKITKKEQRRQEKEALLAKKKELLEIARQNMLKSVNSSDSAKQEANTDSTVEVQEEQIQPVNESESNEELSEEQQAEKLMEEKLKNKVEIPKENCLFCNKKFPYFEECLNHMFKKHGFYIPEQKYLVDKEGLVKYMAEKVGLGNLCFVCSFQGRSLEAARAHMLSKNHCKIPYETEDEKMEISDFYDFTSTYNDQVTEDAEGADEGEWEDVEEGGDVEDEEEEELPQEVSYNDGVELHLPSGVKLGHRSLARYYRQNLKPETVLTEGQGTVIAAESRHLATVHDRAQFLEKKRIWKNEIHHKDRDDRRAAKFINNQPHYRDQLLQ